MVAELLDQSKVELSGVRLLAQPSELSWQSQMLALDDTYAVNINAFLPSNNDSLFNEVAFFKLHAAPTDAYIQLVNKHEKVLATMCVYNTEQQGQYRSPKRGTFGSVALHQSLELPVLEAFIACILNYLREKKAAAFSIKLPPYSHDLALSSLMSNILLRNGFALTNHELNYHMDVTDEAMIDRVSYGNKKRINKCKKNGFVAQQHALTDIAKVYEVIKVNRARKGFPMTMTLAQMLEMTALFPERYYLFSVRHQTESADMMVASAICIALSNTVLYVFYWGDIAGYERYSPITLLATKIYECCQQAGFTQLDVGTSSLNGEPSYGIAQFKRNLGFVESFKPDFELRF